MTMLGSAVLAGASGSVGRRPVTARMNIWAGDGRGDAARPGRQITSRGARVRVHNDRPRPPVAQTAGWSHDGRQGISTRTATCFLARRRTDLIISGGVNIYPRDSSRL